MYVQNKDEVDRAVLTRLQEERKLQKPEDSHETQWVWRQLKGTGSGITL